MNIQNLQALDEQAVSPISALIESAMVLVPRLHRPSYQSIFCADVLTPGPQLSEILFDKDVIETRWEQRIVKSVDGA